jgi:hypothetical protein
MNVVRASTIMVALLFASSVDAQRQQAAPPYTPPSISAEAQAALDVLTPQHAVEVPVQVGWFRDRQITYHTFGVTAAPVAVGRVIWPIHGFDMSGRPVAIRGQRPIFSSLPGLSGYSGVWRLAYLVTADNVQPNVIRDLASAEALVRRGRASMRETDLTFNLPIVPQGSRLARDSMATMDGWYEGRPVQFFDFGPSSVNPNPMLGFVRGQEADGQPAFIPDQFSVVDTLPAASPYGDLWELRLVQADNAFVPNSIKSSSALARTSLRVDPTVTIRNAPIVSVDGTRVPRVPSPLTLFADLRSPFPPAPTRTP